MAKRMIYTKEKVIKQLQNYYKRNGKITRKSFDSDKTVCSASVVLQRFGSWNKALKMAGLETTHRGIYSDEDLLEQLKTYYKKNSKITVQGFAADKT
ncbi:MAG: hypothetical protein LBV03_05830, partial [Fusobacteriales bacterium]|nr:hypothetical protein [Fusobacteriales bacterium]